LIVVTDGDRLLLLEYINISSQLIIVKKEGEGGEIEKLSTVTKTRLSCVLNKQDAENNSVSSNIRKKKFQNKRNTL
jgi:hypothetical protein